MYKYKDLGLSNTKEMFAKANKEGYAVQHLISIIWKWLLL